MSGAHLSVTAAMRRLGTGVALVAGAAAQRCRAWDYQGADHGWRHWRAAGGACPAEYAAADASWRHLAAAAAGSRHSLAVLVVSQTLVGGGGGGGIGGPLLSALGSLGGGAIGSNAANEAARLQAQRLEPWHRPADRAMAPAAAKPGALSSGRAGGAGAAPAAGGA